MADNIKGKFNALSERLKVGGAEVGRKMSVGMSSMSFKMKGIFQPPTQADKVIEEATSENLCEPNWTSIIHICDMVNGEKLGGQDVVRAIKKRIAMKNATVQYLALVLLESCVKNCEKMFSEMASENVLDEMVKVIDDPQTTVSNREKTLKLIEAWGESPEELRYLSVFEETYKSLKARGIRFPARDNESLAPIFTPPEAVTRQPSVTNVAGHPKQSLGQRLNFSNRMPPQSNNLSQEQIKEVFDVARNSIDLLSTVLTSSPQEQALKNELTSALVEQCKQSQSTIQRIIESVGDSESLLFEALNVHDEIQHILSNYEKIPKDQASKSAQSSAPALIAIHVEEEESLGMHHEDSLLRSHSLRPLSNTRSPSAEEAALADLDEMIFGKKGQSPRGQSSKNHGSDDLIAF